MASNAERAERWMDRALGRADRDLGEHGSVFYRGDTIFSYGSHFPMATVIREKPNPNGGWYTGTPTIGEPRWVLINGDSYSVTTSGHQSLVRGVVRTSGLPSIIVPFSALDAAGIERESIELVHVREDRMETLHHSAREVTGPHVEMDDPNGETFEREIPDYTRRLPVTEDNPYGGYATKMIAEPKRVPNPNRRHVNERTWTIADWDEDAQLWRWTTQRHWLGDSLFIARAKGRRRRFLSSFDYQEARALYFLCELPRTPVVRTVEEAYEALKPEPVKAAEQAGLTVSRQGDIFAIPTGLSTREVKSLTPYGKGRIVKRPRTGLLGTNHTASEVIFATRDRIYARGLLYHEPGFHRAPDHARRKMGDGKTWHLLTRNTVPREQPISNRERSVA